MSSPVVLIGLEADGTDLIPSDLQWCFWITSGLHEPPEVRGTDTTVPTRIGTSAGSRVAHRMPIELEGWVRADPAASDHEAAIASYAANCDEIRALFHSTRGRIELRATREDGAVQVIQARPTPGTIWREQVAGYFTELSVVLDGDGDWVAGEGS